MDEDKGIFWLKNVGTKSTVLKREILVLLEEENGVPLGNGKRGISWRGRNFETADWGIFWVRKVY